MNIFLVNNDNESARSLMIKLSGQKREGEMIPCTKKEMQCFHNGDFIQLDNTNKNPSPNLTEIEPGKTYLAVVNPMTDSISDLLKSIKHFGWAIGIVRSRQEIK